MSGDAKYSTYLLIWGFAAAMVALGAQELYRSLAVQAGQPNSTPQQLVGVLHGPLGLDSGRFSPEEIAALKERRLLAAQSRGFSQLLARFSGREQTETGESEKTN